VHLLCCSLTERAYIYHLMTLSELSSFVSVLFFFLSLLGLMKHMKEMALGWSVELQVKAMCVAAYKLNSDPQPIHFLAAKQVLGACWYLLSIERQEACWRSVCNLEKLSCEYGFFDCRRVHDSPHRESWFKSSNITNFCNPDNNYYQFGIYGDALKFDVTTASFFNKYFYCFWWGLRNLR